jgi:hypothetical protein
LVWNKAKKSFTMNTSSRALNSSVSSASIRPDPIRSDPSSLHRLVGGEWCDLLLAAGLLLLVRCGNKRRQSPISSTGGDSDILVGICLHSSGQLLLLLN